jgi:ATP-dependent Clp protease ATP-binding subunit ClpX
MENTDNLGCYRSGDIFFGKTGARGLRAILEDVMLDSMYEIPSQSNVKECLITEEVITKREKPLLIYEESA